MAEEEEYIWKEEIPVPVHLITYVDEGVKEALPAGTQFHGISPSGASYWARTAKIDATDEDGNESPFFIKVCVPVPFLDTPEPETLADMSFHKGASI